MIVVMYENQENELETTLPIDLHYMYGVNCYQHAIGFSDPIIEISESSEPDNILTARYIALLPGNHSEQDAPKNSEEFFNYIISCCEEDGIISLGGNFEQREGFRTMAIFTGTENGGRQGLHFAYLNENDLWEDKIFFRGARTYQNTNECAEANSAQFKSYALVPNDIKPKFIEDIPLEYVELTAENKSITLCRINSSKSDHMLPYVPIIFDMNKNIALIGRDKKTAPLPLLDSNKSLEQQHTFYM